MRLSLTADPIPNQIVGRTCPGTFREDKKYVTLRYHPHEPWMINLDTTGNFEKEFLNIKERKISGREDQDPFGL